MEDKTKKDSKGSTSIRIDPELRRLVDEKVLKLKHSGSKIRTFDAAFHEALWQWLARDADLEAIRARIFQNAEILASANPEELSYAEVLLSVLRSENPEAIGAVISNLRVFFRFIGENPDEHPAFQAFRSPIPTGDPTRDPHSERDEDAHRSVGEDLRKKKAVR